jgi:hypothetical protein
MVEEGIMGQREEFYTKFGICYFVHCEFLFVLKTACSPGLSSSEKLQDKAELQQRLKECPCINEPFK